MHETSPKIWYLRTKLQGVIASATLMFTDTVLNFLFIGNYRRMKQKHQQNLKIDIFFKFYVEFSRWCTNHKDLKHLQLQPKTFKNMSTKGPIYCKLNCAV